MTKAKSQRSCVVCKCKTDQGALARVRFALDRSFLAVDSPGVGRSAYVCRAQACIDGLFEGSRLTHAMKNKVPDSLKAAAHQELSRLQR